MQLMRRSFVDEVLYFSHSTVSRSLLGMRGVDRCLEGEESETLQIFASPKRLELSDCCFPVVAWLKLTPKINRELDMPAISAIEVEMVSRLIFKVAEQANRVNAIRSPSQ